MGLRHRAQELLEGAPDHCTAFTKMMPDGNVFDTNSWCCFWALVVRRDICHRRGLRDPNANCPGQFGSNTDFGFNGNGIGFNETTHVDLTTRPKSTAYGSPTARRQPNRTACSIQEFYEYCSLRQHRHIPQRLPHYRRQHRRNRPPRHELQPLSSLHLQRQGSEDARLHRL